jgi:hypothetical protein
VVEVEPVKRMEELEVVEDILEELLPLIIV